MKNPLKITHRLLALFAACAVLAACAPPASLTSNFPTYAGQSGAGEFVPPSIMDY